MWPDSAAYSASFSVNGRHLYAYCRISSLLSGKLIFTPFYILAVQPAVSSLTMVGPVRVGRSLPLLAMVLLVLGPGLVLGYFGFRAQSEREEGLRISYTATTILVRDRLAAELTRLESSVSPPASQPELASLEASHGLLEMPFILRSDGSVLAARLQAGMLPQPPDALAALPAVAASVSDAEHHEFVRGDLESALRLYRRALTRVPRHDDAARAFVLTRTARTLFKLRQFAEGVVQYRAAAAIAGDAVDRHGLPFAVIALLQIIDGCAALRRPDELAAAQQQYARYVLEHPWDLDNGYGQRLAQVIAYIPPDDTAAHAQAAALAMQAARIHWVRTEVYPRILPELTRRDPPSGELRHAAIPGPRPVLIGYQGLLHGTAKMPAVFAYQVRLEYVSGPLLARVLKTVDLGHDLNVVVTTPEGEGAEGSGTSPSVPLGEAELLPQLPHWKVALFDSRGRSIPQLVAREGWTYGALVAGMLTVMAVGVALTLRASARATELARTRSDFVANVSHELKTPLALIRMFGETLESGIVADPAKRQEFYGIISRESERLTHLIDNVLDVGRIDQGTKQYAIRPQELVETVQAALEAYRPLFDRLGFTVETTFPQPPVIVPMDRDAVIQSLVNLFQNVIKYSGTARHVSVAVRLGGGTASISVADRGVGIPASQIDRIFEWYYRGPQADRAVLTGSGLGLAIVKHTIDAHGGHVTVESSPGEGTTFTLVLPTAANHPAAVQLPASPGPVGV